MKNTCTSFINQMFKIKREILTFRRALIAKKRTSALHNESNCCNTNVILEFTNTNTSELNVSYTIFKGFIEQINSPYLRDLVKHWSTP